MNFNDYDPNFRYTPEQIKEIKALREERARLKKELAQIEARKQGKN